MYHCKIIMPIYNKYTHSQWKRNIVNFNLKFYQNCYLHHGNSLLTFHVFEKYIRLVLEIKYLIVQCITTVRSAATIQIKILKSVPYVSSTCSNTRTTSPRHRRIRRWIRTCSMFLHSACNAAPSYRRVWGCGWPCLTALPSWSHKCSIGLRSDENAGHGSVLIPCWRKKAVVRRAEWGRALSCWNWVTSMGSKERGNCWP